MKLKICCGMPNKTLLVSIDSTGQSVWLLLYRRDIGLMAIFMWAGFDHFAVTSSTPRFQKGFPYFSNHGQNLEDH